MLLVQVPYIQNIAKNKVLNNLSAKLKTELKVGYLHFNIGGKIVIDNIYAGSLQNDTIISISKVKIGFEPLALIKKTLSITSISVVAAKMKYVLYDTSGKTNLTFIPQGNKKQNEDTVKPLQNQPTWHLVVKKASLENSVFSYKSVPDGKILKVNAGFLEVKAPESDIISKKFVGNTAYVSNVHVAYISYAQAIIKAPQPADTAKNSLTLGLNRLIADNISFAMADSLTGSDSYFGIDSADITPEKVDLSSKTITVRNIDVRHGKMKYTLVPSAATETKNSSSVNTLEENNDEWNITLKKSNIIFDSIKLKSLINKQLQNMFALNNILLDFNASYSLPGKWSGNIRNLSFTDSKTNKKIILKTNTYSENNRIHAKSFNIKAGQSFLNLNGEMLLGGNKAILVPDFKINIGSSKIFKSDILPYVQLKSDSLIPSEISLLLNASSTGGNTQVNGSLLTDAGQLNYDINFEQVGKIINSKYSVKLEFVNFNPGKLLHNPSLGPLAGTIDLSGKGLNIDSAVAGTSAFFSTIYLNGRTYRNAALSGSVTNGKVLSNLSINDSVANIKLTVQGTAFPNRDLNAKIVLGRLDLLKTGLLKDTVLINGNLNIAYKSTDSTHMSINLDTCHLVLDSPNDILSTDNSLKYSVKSDTVEANFNSTFGDFSYFGNQNIGAISKIIKTYSEKYFVAQKGPDTLKNAFFVFTFEFQDLSLLKSFLPLSIATPDKVYAEAKLSNNTLSGLLDLKKIVLPGIEADSLKLVAEGKDSGFNFNMGIESLKAGANLIRSIKLNGNLNNGNLVSRFSFNDNKDKDWFSIGFKMQPNNPKVNLSILSPLMINHMNWTVDTDNLVSVEDNNPIFRKFFFENGGRRLDFHNNTENIRDIIFNFKNLNMNFFSALLIGDTTSLSGKIGGNISVLNSPGKGIPVFDASIIFSDITSAHENLGNLYINASNKTNNDQIDVSVNLGADIKTFVLNGSYNLKNKDPFNINMSISGLDMAALAPLISSFARSPKGEINSNLNLTGSILKPRIKGEIDFSGFSAFINSAGTSFKIDKQKINFRGNRIEFPSFTLRDVSNNPLTINGNVTIDSLPNISYNLNINSKEFLAYVGAENNPSITNNKVITTTNINLISKNAAPVVNATIQIDEGSSFYYKITNRSAGISEKGLIEFVGPGNKDSTLASQKVPLSENLNVTANITIADKTPITIITDPARNIGLNVKAGGTFSFIQRPLQSPRLVGKIFVSGGDYTLVLTGIKRTFTLSDSSTIAWYGDIANPELNLKAMYQVRTSPAELVGEQPIQYSTLPFNVNMIISGGLSNPSFKFNLSLPEEYQGAYNGLVASKLQEINSNESDLNQKAMMLILFGSFGFTDIRSIFGSSQDKTNILISNALNQFAQQKIKFVDLHFDLQSFDDYGGVTGGYQRTQLSIGASKKFFDERLETRLGATFIIQGDEREQQKSFINRTIPEYNIQYIINKPRTLSVKSFRSSDYKGIIEGRVISTGIGIVFQKDFNSLGDFLRKIYSKEAIH